MKITVTRGQGVKPLKSRPTFLKVLRLAAVATGFAPDTKGCIGFVLLNADEMAELNALHLGHDGPTDVITYDYRPGFVPLAEEEEEEDQIFAEVYLCPEVARAYARRQRQSPSRELVLYAVHGLLHLAGEDDQQVSARSRMRLAEQQVMCRLEEAFDLDVFLIESEAPLEV